MISFKSFLAEARMAPLYHATSEENALSVLNNNILRAYTQHEHDRANKSNKPRKDVVSLTRSYNFAKEWQRHRRNKWYVIFELDQQKLAQNYKLVPYSHFQDRIYSDRAIPVTRELYDVRKDKWEFPINQYEENVIGDIKDVRKYITKIYYNNPYFKDELEAYGLGKLPLERIK